MSFKFAPDLANWTKTDRKTYVRNDGIAKVEHRDNRWIPFVRANVDAQWVESKYCYLALHAAQDGCRRDLAKLLEWVASYS